MNRCSAKSDRCGVFVPRQGTIVQRLILAMEHLEAHNLVGGYDIGKAEVPREAAAESRRTQRAFACRLSRSARRRRGFCRPSEPHAPEARSSLETARCARRGLRQACPQTTSSRSRNSRRQPNLDHRIRRRDEVRLFESLFGQLMSGQSFRSSAACLCLETRALHTIRRSFRLKRDHGWQGRARFPFDLAPA